MHIFQSYCGNKQTVTLSKRPRCTEHWRHYSSHEVLWRHWMVYDVYASWWRQVFYSKEKSTGFAVSGWHEWFFSAKLLHLLDKSSLKVTKQLYWIVIDWRISDFIDGRHFVHRSAHVTVTWLPVSYVMTTGVMALWFWQVRIENGAKQLISIANIVFLVANLKVKLDMWRLQQLTDNIVTPRTPLD